MKHVALLALLLSASQTSFGQNSDLNKIIAVQQAEIENLRNKYHYGETLETPVTVKPGDDTNAALATRIFKHPVPRAGAYLVQYSLSFYPSIQNNQIARNFKVMVLRNGEVELISNQQTPSAVAGQWTHGSGSVLLPFVQKGDLIEIVAVNPNDSGSSNMHLVGGGKHSSFSLIQL